MTASFGLENNLSSFKCVNCGACCRQEGYVRLGPKEPDKIALYLEMDVYSYIENIHPCNKGPSTPVFDRQRKHHLYFS